LVWHDAHPYRGHHVLLVGRRGQWLLLMFSGDRAYGELLVTEGGVPEQPIERVDQRSVTTPIDVQTPDLIGLLGSIEIAEDIGATEGVDRLLRIADQDQGGGPVKRARKDFPR